MPPVTTGGSRCGSGAVALSASGASIGEEYRWYNSAGQQVGIGSGYTANVTNTTDFYVSIYNTTTYRESPKTKVTATVVPLPAIAGITGASQVAVGGSIQLACATNGGTWSSEATSIFYQCNTILNVNWSRPIFISKLSCSFR